MGVHIKFSKPLVQECLVFSYAPYIEESRSHVDVDVASYFVARFEYIMEVAVDEKVMSNEVVNIKDMLSNDQQVCRFYA